MSWMAPRGIVAAAVASVFALQMQATGHPDADRVVPTIFAVIVGTVTVYGLTSGPLARALGLAHGEAKGVLILGAHDWARKIAKALQGAGLDVLLVDRNYRDVNQARIDGLDAFYGNVLSEEFELRAPLDEMGFFLCMTPNDEVNALTCLQYAPEFERSRLFQVAPARLQAAKEDVIPQHLRGNVLFGREHDFWKLQARFRAGHVVKVTTLSEEFTYTDFQATYHREDAPVIPLFLLDGDDQLTVVSAKDPADPEPGDTLIALVQPEEA